MTTWIFVLIIVGAAAAAIFYHYRFPFLNIEKARIKKRLAAGESQPSIKKTRLNKTAIKVILVALAIILLPITLATAFFGFIWYWISSNVSGGILLLIGYWWIVVVALVTRSLYHKLGVIMVVGSIGALIPPLLSAVMGISEYLHARYELALQEVKEEERLRVDGEQKKAEEREAKEALARHEKAIELKPEDADAWLNKGWALYHLGRNKEALEAFDKATELDPHDPFPCISRGMLLLQLRLYNGALQAFEKATEVDPKDPITWSSKGWVLEQLNRPKEALKAYEKGMLIDPDDADLRQDRDRILSELGGRKITRGKELQWKLEAYEDYYWDLPIYGDEEEGTRTSEFAEIIGDDSGVARKVLERWRALGRVTRRPSHGEYGWWRREA